MGPVSRDLGRIREEVNTNQGLERWFGMRACIWGRLGETRRGGIDASGSSGLEMAACISIATEKISQVPGLFTLGSIVFTVQPNCSYSQQQSVENELLESDDASKRMVRNKK